VNFLFDKNLTPNSSPDKICDYFGVSKSTVGQKATVIHNMFKLSHFSIEFSTERMIERNPFNRIAMVNGYLVMLDT